MSKLKLSDKHTKEKDTIPDKHYNDQSKEEFKAPTSLSNSSRMPNSFQ